MKRIASSILAFWFVLGSAWTLGFNFNERGLAAFLVFYIGVLVPFFVYIHPSWKENK